MSPDVKELKNVLSKVKAGLSTGYTISGENLLDYALLNENLSRSIALLEGRDAQIGLLKQQLEDYRTLLIPTREAL